MSRKIKQKNKVDRLQAKRARKSANQAHYAELRRLGINGKSRRAKANAKKHKRHNGISHFNGACGNVGCKRCFPEIYQLGLEYQQKIHNLYLVKHPRTVITVVGNPGNFLKKRKHATQ
jgi:hypothetical protein